MIEEAYKLLKEQLAADLLEQITAKSPAFFEELVIRLLVKMGYGGRSRTHASRGGTAMVVSTA